MKDAWKCLLAVWHLEETLRIPVDYLRLKGITIEGARDLLKDALRELELVGLYCGIDVERIKELVKAAMKETEPNRMRSKIEEAHLSFDKMLHEKVRRPVLHVQDCPIWQECDRKEKTSDCFLAESWTPCEGADEDLCAECNRDVYCGVHCWSVSLAELYELEA